jgi:methionyl-tRNA synthetase
MVHKYLDGVVPQGDAAPESQLDLDVKLEAEKTIGDYREAMEGFAFHKAMMALWQFINRINKYIDVTAPWELAKKKSQHDQLQVVLYNIVESLRIIAGLLYPVMPRTARVMEEHLGVNSSKGFQSVQDLSVWGKIKPGSKLLKTTTLFPRVDTDKPAAQPSEDAGPQKEAASHKPEVPIQAFEKVDLRVAKVLHAEPIPRSKKLLKLKVDAGEERTVVAGIAESYQPEDLIGKQVVIVANLKPAKLMGVLSSGMVLTASDKDKCKLITVEGEVEPGTPLA